MQKEKRAARLIAQSLDFTVKSLALLPEIRFPPANVFDTIELPTQEGASVWW